jgi:hypothetical protein
MTAPVRDMSAWLTLDQCADITTRAYALEQLAERVTAGWDDIDDQVIERELARYAHTTLTTEQRNLAFDEHVTARRRLADLELGVIGWIDVIENLTCVDKTQAAREHLDACAEIAMNELLHGNGGAQ